MAGEVGTKTNLSPARASLLGLTTPSSETWHEALSNKNIRIPRTKNNWLPLSPALWQFWAENGGIFKSCLRVSKLLI